MTRKAQAIGVRSATLGRVGMWLRRYSHRGVCGSRTLSANERLPLLCQDILEAYAM